LPNKTLFRSAALEQLSSPDALDQLLQVTRPTGWMALLACALLLLVALLWGWFGSLPITVTGQGVLLAPGGVRDIVSLSAGQLVSLDVNAGDTVTPGQVVARLIETGQSTATDIISPYAGRVLELQVIAGGVVERGDALLSLEAAEREDLEAIVYIPAAEGNKIQPGMPVLIAPASVKQEEHGRLLGQVVSVGDFPASRRGMLRVLGSEELLAALMADSATIEVRVALRSDSQTPSGYAWTSVQGPALPLSSGTLCTAWIETSVKRPISLLFP